MKQELEEFRHLHLLVYCSKYGMRSALWLYVLCAFCAFRAANQFTVYMAYFILILRAFQIVCLMSDNRDMAEGSIAFISFFSILMFFAEFANESADIVHEVLPVESHNPYTLMGMRGNYDPLT